MTAELSIVVPVLNEAAAIPKLLRALAEQRTVTQEVIVCDGGSTDGTVEVTQRAGRDCPFPVRIVSSLPGRALQLNAGAAASSGDTLLFLHADSLFLDPLALRKGLDTITAAIARKGSENVAGHFALRFNREDAGPSAAYYYMEAKARLDRRDCTHGDQGCLMRRRFFESAGGFDEAGFPTETCLAETIRAWGEWVLLPAEIITSARRFETEGLYERQVLNAIVMNFAAMGWDDFFREILSLYPPHDQCRKLELFPLLKRIDRLISLLPLRRRLSLWYATGTYVRSHAWQIPFFFDTYRNYRRGIRAGEGRAPFLALHDRYFDRFTDTTPGRVSAASLTYLWFRLTCLHALLCRKSERR